MPSGYGAIPPFLTMTGAPRFDGPSVSRGLLNVSTNLLIRDRLEYTEDSKPIVE